MLNVPDETITEYISTNIL